MLPNSIAKSPMIASILFIVVGSSAVATQAADEQEQIGRPYNIDAAQKITADVVNNGTRSPLELQPGPIYAYDEQVRGWHRGSSWVWGGLGRPAIFLNISFHNRVYYEFISLAQQSIVVNTGYDTSWTPEPEWNPKPINGTNAPATTRRMRLQQMRSIARRFSAYQIDHDDSFRERHLRLLPQPIYRYAKESQESVDGGIFGFVRDGDLEIILIVEATTGPNPRWVFECKRVAIFEQHVKLNDIDVWSCDRIHFHEASNKNAYHIFIRNPVADELP